MLYRYSAVCLGGNRAAGYLKRAFCSQQQIQQKLMAVDLILAFNCDKAILFRCDWKNLFALNRVQMDLIVLLVFFPKQETTCNRSILCRFHVFDLCWLYTVKHSQLYKSDVSTDGTDDNTPSQVLAPPTQTACVLSFSKWTEGRTNAEPWQKTYSNWFAG